MVYNFCSTPCRTLKMPSIKLTKSFINNFDVSKLKSKVDYFDSEVKGLIIRISPSGVKSYRLILY